MGITSGKNGQNELVGFTGRLVKCGRYAATLFVSLANCRECEFHRGEKKISAAANGRPEVWDILCGYPVHRRVEYIVKTLREVTGGGSE